MDYQGYKLVDKIMLICRDALSTFAESEKIYQAYLVDPSNKKQIESARHWAKWTEYGPSFKNEESGRWEHEYEIKHEPVEFNFDNNGFTLELLDCAGGSSQGGKLSFWNCLVKKDNLTFKIGINSDMLLELLKNATFVNGKCQSSLIFITQKGKVGMTVEGSATWQQCVKDRELKKSLTSKATSKFTFGDKVSTPTINDVYLGTITKYYEFDSGDNSSYYHRGINLRECTITKLKKPITYYMFESLFRKETLTSILDGYDSSLYSYPDLKKTCPKRTITGKIKMDCTEADFKQRLMSKIYDYEAFLEYAKTSYYYKGTDADKLIYYFLGKNTFGYGFDDFELDSKLLDLAKASGVRYVEE